MPRLTDARVSAIKPPQTGQAEHADDLVRGLRLRVGAGALGGVVGLGGKILKAEQMAARAENAAAKLAALRGQIGAARTARLAAQAQRAAAASKATKASMLRAAAAAAAVKAGKAIADHGAKAAQDSKEKK